MNLRTTAQVAASLEVVTKFAPADGCMEDRLLVGVKHTSKTGRIVGECCVIYSPDIESAYEALISLAEDAIEKNHPQTGNRRRKK